MSTSMFLEVEARFSVADSIEVPDLTLLDGVAAIASTTTHRLSATYYDTADLRLTRSRVVLRRRSGGDDAGWHVKFPADGARLEIHAPATDEDATIPETLLDHVRVLIRREELSPIARVDNVRVVSVLVDDAGSPVAEFCDDSVTARSFLPGGTATSWREWELELAGEEREPTLMESATTVFTDAGAQVSHSPSKLVTALGDSVDAAPAPPFLASADVPEDSPTAAVIAALARNRDKILDYDPRVKRDEWDSVHQMRVATRELRSHLETFEGLLNSGELEFIESELKLLAEVLGRARDAEVVDERFRRLVETDDTGLIDDTTRGHLLEDMTQDYRRAHRGILKTLNSDRYFTLLDTIDALFNNPEVLETPTGAEEHHTPTPQEVEAVLVEHLQTAYRQLRKRHRKAVSNRYNEEIPLHTRESYFHDVRKSAKKVRYATEAIGAATSLETEHLYDACKALQSSLGEFQDAVTSRDRILRLASGARRRGEDAFAYGLLYQREFTATVAALDDYDEEAEEIHEAYKQLEKTARKKAEKAAKEAEKRRKKELKKKRKNRKK